MAAWHAVRSDAGYGGRTDTHRLRAFAWLGQGQGRDKSAREKRAPGGLVTSIIRGSEEPANELWGLGRWLNDGSYGTWPDDLWEISQPVERNDRGIRSMRVFQGDTLNALREAAIDQFVTRIRNWPEQAATVPTRTRNR